MKDINVRYGASVELLSLSDDPLATSATMYIGLEGGLPIITKTNTFVDGVADLSLDPIDTEIPLGIYKYQINVTYSDGKLKKFPEPRTCNDSLPNFTVYEALDVIEVS